MQKQWLLGCGVLLGGATAVVACVSNGTVGDGVDASTPDGSAPDVAAPADAGSHADVGTVPSDAAQAPDTSADAGDASLPPRLLLSYNASATSELVAFGLQSNAVDGRFVYPGFIGTTYVNPASPWLMEQADDVVGLLDPQEPWVVSSSWNVALDDEGDGGFAASYSDPVAVVAGPGTKAYVLRYTRNDIAVIDTSVVADGGLPVATIDLSSQLQAGGDGYVEMTAGWYDATNQRLYVLLGNINRGDVGCTGYCQLCSDTSPTIVAIDTTTNALVPIGADGGTSYLLGGYDPAFGAAMAYDSTNNRLLVLETGCNTALEDGGVGPIVKREVEAVSLANGSAQELLDLTPDAFPAGLFYIDPHHAIVQLDTAYTWDPTTSTLGPAIPNAPEAFDIDGQGNLVGVTENYLTDGGFGGFSVISVNPSDGGVTTLGQNPFSLGNSGFIGGAQLWPRP
jgi:hypothetical protein